MLRCMKRAVRREPNPIGLDSPLYVLCDCGRKVSLPQIAGLPMLYRCECGITYDKAGWIQPELGQWDKQNWVAYQHGGDRFIEDIGRICEYLGSQLYEWKFVDGWYFIRRVE